MPHSIVDSNSFLDVVRETPELRPFPVTATRLISATADPGIGAGDLAAIFRHDPALSVRVLQVANSSLYGYSGNITTVSRAVVVLGFRAVRNLALAIAASSVYAHGETSHAERSRLWRHSVGCAAVARLLAEEVPGVTADEAFLAGIVHDVGKLIFFDLVPERYRELAALGGGGRGLQLEGCEFGATHTEVGRLCAEQWGLPDELCQAISGHHLQDTSGYSPGLVAVTNLANQLSAAWGIGTDAATDSASLPELPEQNLIPLSAGRAAEIRKLAQGDFDIALTSIS